MTEKEIIEKMARDIRVALEIGTYENLPIYIKDRVLTGVRFNETAKILANKYQPKIPEGSVVLTKEEYESLQMAKDFNYGYHEGEKNMTSYYENIKLPEERKETAKEIIKLIDEIEKNNPNGWIGALHIKQAIAKQCGVEE